MRYLIVFVQIVSLLSFHFSLANSFGVKRLLQDSLTAHNQAENYAEWEEATHHPHLIFDKLRNLPPAEQKPFQEELCKELKLLKPEQAAIFYSELSHWLYDNPNDCLEMNLAKVDIYFHGQGNILKKGFSQTHARPQTADIPELLGPSRVEIVNTETGPIFNYGERGHLGKKELALTFDDGPHPRLTVQLLEILAEEDVQVTFFTVGKNTQAYGSIVNQLIENKHTLGTHSYSHRNLPKLDYQSAVKDIESAFDAALAQVGLVAPFFRFPFGSKNSQLTQFVKDSQFANFFWDVDTLDWKKTNPTALLKYALDQIEKVGNGIVLFHDIQPQTIAIMPTLLLELKARGYKMVVYQPDKEIVLNTRMTHVRESRW